MDSLPSLLRNTTLGRFFCVCMCSKYDYACILSSMTKVWKIWNYVSRIWRVYYFPMSYGQLRSKYWQWSSRTVVSTQLHLLDFNSCLLLCTLLQYHCSCFTVQFLLLSLPVSNGYLTYYIPRFCIRTLLYPYACLVSSSDINTSDISHLISKELLLNQQKIIKSILDRQTIHAF